MELMCAKSVKSCLTLRGPMTIAHQAPLSMGILQARILEWVAVPSSWDLSDPGIEPASLRSSVLVGELFTTSATWEAQVFNKGMRPRLQGSVQSDEHSLFKEEGCLFVEL